MKFICMGFVVVEVLLLELCSRNLPYSLAIALIQRAHARQLFLLQGLRSSIPPNFPYFSAEIGLSSGHVHVIDDEADFDDDFGRGVLVGLLQLPAEMMHKKAKQESQSIQVCSLNLEAIQIAAIACAPSFRRPGALWTKW